MTLEELQQQRREKWRIAGRPVRTLDDARAFISDVGLCVQYPQRGRTILPTFIGACVGSEEKLPTTAHAFADPRTKDATELMVRLLRERSAYEWPMGEGVLIVAASIFPFFYALASDRGGKQEPQWAAGKKLSKLALDAWRTIESAKQPVSRARLRDTLGRELSTAALDRALHELWARLRITRVDYSLREGGVWESLARWSADAVTDGAQLSLPSALSALVSQFLATMIAAEQAEIESFFSTFVARAKTREAVSALLAAREIDLVHIGQSTMLQIASREPQGQPRDSARNQPIVSRFKQSAKRLQNRRSRSWSKPADDPRRRA